MWLIDLLQLLVEENHGTLLYPNWTNTADYADTTESFGTVRLHSDFLDAALQQIKLDRRVTEKFSPDMKYLCRRMRTPAPLLPVHGEEECKLFDLLVRTTHVDLDFDQMAIDWCNKVDGVTIFPKLPVYLRTHHTAWLRNQKVRDAVRTAASGEAELRRLNEEMTTTRTVSIGQHSPLRPAVYPTPDDGTPVVVAGIAVSGQVQAAQAKRKHGNRGADKKQRKSRVCGRCMRNGRVSLAAECKGSGGVQWCSHKGDGDK